MKAVNVKSGKYIDLTLMLKIIKILNLKLVTMSEYFFFFSNCYSQNPSEDFVTKKVVSCTCIIGIIGDLNGEERCMKKKCKRQIKQSLEMKK